MSKKLRDILENTAPVAARDSSFDDSAVHYKFDSANTRERYRDLLDRHVSTFLSGSAEHYLKDHPYKDSQVPDSRMITSKHIDHLQSAHQEDFLQFDQDHSVFEKEKETK